jgi:hypothetical protein
LNIFIFIISWFAAEIIGPPNVGSKFPAVTITVFITIHEQNRQNSCQSSTTLSEVNVKDTFTSHIDKEIFLTFVLSSPFRSAIALSVLSIHGF